MFTVLVLGMQKDAVDKGSILDMGEGGRAIVPNIKRLLDVARERKALVIYTSLYATPGDPIFEKVPPHCLPGTVGIEIIDELKPKERDYIVNTYRMNAFLFTNLEHILSFLHVDTLIITGQTTNTGCLLTAMEAFQRGFKVIIASDGCATYKEEKHRWALEYLKPFAKILTADEVTDLLKR